MNVENISVWAEIIEAVVIIVSLIYLALQVRQNTRTTRAAAAQAQIDAYSSVIAPLAQSREGAKAWFLGLQDVNKLKDEQVVMFYVEANMFFRMIESSYYQHKNGALEPQLWEGLERLALQFYTHKGMQQFMKVRGFHYSDEFKAWLKVNSKAFSEKNFVYRKPKTKNRN